MPPPLVSRHGGPAATPGLPRPLRPLAAPSRRPWAGRRLGEGIGELWLAGPASQVEIAGERVTLDRLAELHGAAFVGSRAIERVGVRFPLLIKLIDAAAWLSVQVHPSNEVAAELSGPGFLGKTEAWVVLDADPAARLITGPRAAMTEAELRAAIGSGTIDRPDCETREARAGDSYLIPPGTIHAIGPGLLVYEIEQPSDLTYRISDWGRPASAERPLHTREALRAVDPAAHAVPAGSAFHLDAGALTVRDLRLEIVSGAGVDRAPDGATLEVVTAIRGRVEVAGDGWRETLERHQTLVVPARVDRYSVATRDRALAFVGSVP
jgi:mannose-6-phosphate isomerase